MENGKKITKRKFSKWMKIYDVEILSIGPRVDGDFRKKARKTIWLTLWKM